MASAEMWDAVAAAWERLATPVDEQLARATARMLELAGVKADADVLDLAAGAGGAGLAAAAVVGPGGSVVLSDISPAMVAAASRRADGLAQVRTLVSDLTAIDSPAASFDAVICRHGMMFLPEPAAAIREAVRVLRPGGRVAVATWSARAENPWLALIFDAVGAQFGVQFPPEGAPGPFSLADPQRLEAVLTDGGLDDARVERVATPLAVASLEAWWARVPHLAGPLAQALASLDADGREAIHARAVAAAAAVARDTADGLELDGAVLLGSGRAPG